MRSISIKTYQSLNDDTHIYVCCVDDSPCCFISDEFYERLNRMLYKALTHKHNGLLMEALECYECVNETKSIFVK